MDEDKKWPKLDTLTYDELSEKVLEFCTEMSNRSKELKGDMLNAALKIWPSLHQSLHEKGKEVGLNDMAEPCFPEWAEEPVVALAGWYGKKPKNKAEAKAIALKYGHTGWGKISEIWLWLIDCGPIVEKAMKEFGYMK